MEKIKVHIISHSVTSHQISMKSFEDLSILIKVK